MIPFKFALFLSALSTVLYLLQTASSDPVPDFMGLFQPKRKVLRPARCRAHFWTIQDPFGHMQQGSLRGSVDFKLPMEKREKFCNSDLVATIAAGCYDYAVQIDQMFLPWVRTFGFAGYFAHKISYCYMNFGVYVPIDALKKEAPDAKEFPPDVRPGISCLITAINCLRKGRQKSIEGTACVRTLAAQLVLII